MRRSIPHMFKDWFDKKTNQSVADYLNSFEERRRFRNKIKFYLMVFFLVTYGILLYNKIDEMWVSKRERENSELYVKKYSRYKDSLNLVIDQMEDELIQLRYELKKRKR